MCFILNTSIVNYNIKIQTFLNQLRARAMLGTAIFLLYPPDRVFFLCVEH